VFEAPLINPKPKLLFINRLKVVLTVLVILHHAAITYGAPGGWYYSQKTALTGALLPMTAFVAVNQAFFMGFFFFLSALFIPSSYNTKGTIKFIIDRLLRLGIPLLFYSFILSPFLSFMPYNYTGTHPRITYLQYLNGFDGWINFGVLWFVLALLVFTLLYTLFRLLTDKEVTPKRAPTAGRILLFAAGVGVVTYFVRISFPVGRVLEPLGFQLGHFPQYVAMFTLGIVASQSNWLNTFRYQAGKQILYSTLIIIFFGFPLFFILQKWLNFPVSYFNVGGHWQTLWYAVWEQLVGFGMVTALLCIGRVHWNRPSAFLDKLSRTTFAVYIFHPLVLIALSVLAHSWDMDPAFKLIIIGPLAVAGSFLLGSALIKIPGVNKII
jgi:surface polysaccharide O-acyltransferase-like enzyme